MDTICRDYKNEILKLLYCIWHFYVDRGQQNVIFLHTFKIECFPIAICFIFIDCYDNIICTVFQFRQLSGEIYQGVVFNKKHVNWNIKADWRINILMC